MKRRDLFRLVAGAAAAWILPEQRAAWQNIMHFRGYGILPESVHLICGPPIKLTRTNDGWTMIQIEI